MSISANLKRAMDAGAVSVASLAALSGVERGFLNKYLSGKVRPSESVLARLARALEISVDELTAERITRTGGKVRPEDAARRLGRGAQDIRVGLQLGLLPFGVAYKRPGSSIYTYEIDPGALERYAEDQERFWKEANHGKSEKPL